MQILLLHINRLKLDEEYENEVEKFITIFSMNMVDANEGYVLSYVN